MGAFHTLTGLLQVLPPSFLQAVTIMAASCTAWCHLNAQEGRTVRAAKLVMSCMSMLSRLGTPPCACGPRPHRCLQAAQLFGCLACRCLLMCVAAFVLLLMIAAVCCLAYSQPAGSAVVLPSMHAGLKP
jgi:hypothetical protein